MLDTTQETALKLYGNRIRIRVCGVCIENGLILLVCHQGIIDAHEVWLPPGGGLEENETLTAALEREFLEETGLHVNVGAFLFKSEFIHTPLHGIELYFAVKVVAGTLKKGHDPETDGESQLIREVKWVPVENRDFLSEDLYLAINN